MQLSKIKLSGFKSFVDPITVPFPGQLIGIVGPNGCGKSNIIDAVRWVMGEGSAKNLRGESMADVIFNGSVGRKPVGHASVELVFDNSDGGIGGEYAGYAEIAIKRVVSRDGTSNYFLNNTRCRRKDITDIFLGTGLGPRSYSIIEQGMISRLIEARPEDLRVFLEEAAGISKYKERRRETENRMGHTRENLERVLDLRGELEKQLGHLNRQARAAERYKELKIDERKVRAELLALKWRALDKALAERQRAIRERETALEAAVAEQRKAEATIEHSREEHTEANDAFNAVQARFYAVGADIARVEQAMQHAKEMRQKQQQDLAQAEHGWSEVEGHIVRDRAQIEELARTLAEMTPGLERLQSAEHASGEALAQAEAAMADWQQRWEAFTREAGEPARAAEVERTRLDHLEREQRQQTERLDKVEAELAQVAPENVARELSDLEGRAADLASKSEQIQQQLQHEAELLRDLRGTEQDRVTALDANRRDEQQVAGRLASLEALQQAALGQDDDRVVGWLKGQRLADNPRLGATLRVEAGWERAVETVLGAWLEAVCVDGIDPVAGALSSLDGASLALFEGWGQSRSTLTPVDDAVPLSTKVESAQSISGLLAGVYAAPDLTSALAQRKRLRAGESVVTPDGVWLGEGWLRVIRDTDGHAGVLARGEEIRALKEQAGRVAERSEKLAAELVTHREQVRDAELAREQLQSDANRTHRQHAELVADLNARKERSAQIEQRREQLAGELAELERTNGERDNEIRSARQRLEEAVSRMAGFERQRESLDADRERFRATLETARQQARADHEAVHQLALQAEAKRSSRASLEQNLARMESQLAQLAERRDALTQALSGGDGPLAEQKAELERMLQARSGVERELADARRKLEDIDTQLRDLEQQRAVHEQRVAEVRESVQQLKLDAQEEKVRAQGLTEQLAETGHTLESLFQQLPDDADSAAWEQQLEQIENRINRLGPINLAAIDEFKELSERKEKLDAQYTDLTDALTTLENAIRKIDRETRTRFKETFDKVNTGLQATFPKLFGGGHAYLELTGDDLLNTGVTVMARPPGKRNSTIHLLSGGEKALTAVALVFSIFELNPSPFCMLDEVDAPLDDANVGRFCELVREMSRRVQFILITHNKVTMELAQQLTGVTMQEPGVSRLVAVDIDEAVQMAAM
ncbi:MAG: chromosome segregation protein SMC [Gammaproteobacteria bacterium]